MISIANVKLVYGAPCSGKSTYVNEQITDRDIRFDYDGVLAAISNSGPHDNREELRPYGVGIRGLMLEMAGDDGEIENAYIIACKITDNLLEQIGGAEVEYILIDKAKDEVLEQLENDDTRADKEYWKGLIDEWYEWHEAWSAAQQSAAKEVAGIKKRYYALTVDGREASVYIFGDIVSWPWIESDVSSYTLAKEIEGLDVDVLNVYINSYGGEVAEGLAIYNQLRRHKAKVKTHCDGFACSAASVVFMAGDERIMSNASLLMIHNAWMLTAGDPNDLRKDADDLETINQASINAYMNHVSITEDELKAMMKSETWIAPADALEMGFATMVTDGKTNKSASQRYRKQVADMILTQRPRAMLEQAPEMAPIKQPEQKPKVNLKNLVAALVARKEEAS